MTSNLFFSGLLPPKNLEFGEITSRSFRTTWLAPTTNVIGYLVRFRKAEDITGDYISMAVAGDTTTTILPHLYPLTAYEVNVFAQYELGDSFPLTGEETTLEGKRDLVTQICCNSYQNENILNLKYSLLFRARDCTKPTSYRGDDQQLQGVMASCSRFGDQVSLVLCPAEWCWGSTGGPNHRNGDYHRSPRAFPHHHLPCVCVCWVFLRCRGRDASRWNHQGRWVGKTKCFWQAAMFLHNEYGLVSDSFLFCFQSVALLVTFASLTRPYPQWKWHGRRLQEMSFSTALRSNLPRAAKGRRYPSREIPPGLCWRTSNHSLNMSCLSVLATLLVWVILFWAQEPP